MKGVSFPGCHDVNFVNLVLLRSAHMLRPVCFSSISLLFLNNCLRACLDVQNCLIFDLVIGLICESVFCKTFLAHAVFMISL